MVSNLFLECQEKSVKIYDDEVNCGDLTNGNNESERKWRQQQFWLYEAKQ